MSAVAHIDEYKTGRFYTDEYRGDMSWNGYEYNNLLRNEGCRDDGTPQFSDVAMAVGADDQKDARGVAIADYDNDGDLDVAINHNVGDHNKTGRADAVLLRNDIGDRRSWLAVELEGTTSNRDAVGATVLLEVGDERQLRLMSAGSSYASQNSQRLYFGLGESQVVDRLTVRWPGGGSDTFENIAAGQLIRIVEGSGEPALTTLEPGVLGGPREAEDGELLAEVAAPTTSASPGVVDDSAADIDREKGSVAGR